MNCEEIKKLILTDYSDSQLEQTLLREIKEHLDACNKCKEFAQSVRHSVIEPFRNIERFSPPEYVWHRIKSKIERQPKSVFVGFFENLRLSFQMPRPALAMVTITIVIIIVLVITKLPISTQDVVNIYLEEQVDFISELAENGEDFYFVTEDINLGTNIEKYLL
jgi:anti-sigma factor RsiW